MRIIGGNGSEVEASQGSRSQEGWRVATDGCAGHQGRHADGAWHVYDKHAAGQSCAGYHGAAAAWEAVMAHGRWWRCVHGIAPASQCSECGSSDSPELPDGIRRHMAELEAALFRANNVTRQTQEIADQRGRRIMELQTEVAALTETLRTLFKSAAETPSDAEQFPHLALAHSWATKGTSR